MKINIYYGGRGLVDDPTMGVLEKVIRVLEELRVDVTRYNLCEEKQGINMLSQSIKEVDGIILATTVEWVGVGGYMQQFLDSCWFYADKNKIKDIYMLPIVIATSYGEREGENFLAKCWETLGGRVVSGICAYVSNQIEFETNVEYSEIIEKKVENFYRSINKKTQQLPSSQCILRNKFNQVNLLELTPEESEELSVFVSDDHYIKKQKQDIEELSSLFKNLLGEEVEGKEDVLKRLSDSFIGLERFIGSYCIDLETEKLIIEVKDKKINAYYGENSNVDVVVKMNQSIWKKIYSGKISFQEAFMQGCISAKGDFKILKSFDALFKF